MRYWRTDIFSAKENVNKRLRIRNKMQGNIYNREEGDRR
jgi:hypothetical protein